MTWYVLLVLASLSQTIQSAQEKECVNDTHCSPDTRCEAELCVAVCLPNPCGDNTRCNVVDREPVCTCNDGYINATSKGCVKGDCTDDNQCTSSQACLNNTCTNLCALTLCGTNATCDVIDLRITCTCLVGYIGNPYTACTKAECTLNINCTSNQTCQDNKCVDVCQDKCGNNTDCQVVDRQPSCKCTKDYIGNPYNGCERAECFLNINCTSNQTCQDNKCVDVCQDKCGNNTDCQVVDRRPSCKCMKGYIGNPYNGCERAKTDEFKRVCEADESSQCTINLIYAVPLTILLLIEMIICAFLVVSILKNRYKPVILDMPFFNWM